MWPRFCFPLNDNLDRLQNCLFTHCFVKTCNQIFMNNILWNLLQNDSLYYLYSLFMFLAHDGFVGCIRNLVIQNVSHDPIYLLHTHRGIYGVIADGCHLIPHCNNGPHCQHEGRCLADWNGVSCDCSKTAYEGHACHFRK